MQIPGIKISDQYIDGRNVYNIRNIELPLNQPPYLFGKYITDTTDVEVDSFSSEDSGMIVYQDEDNPNIGYRIYKGLLFAQKNFYFPYGSLDARLISELQQRQSSVKLTDFPTGIVTLNNYIIANEIVFYNNHDTLRALAYKLKDNPQKIDIITAVYLSMLKSFEELTENEIFYNDIHTKNIMVDRTDYNKTKIIDFESGHVSFGNLTQSNLESYQQKFANVINYANHFAGIDYKLGKLVTDKPIEEATEEVLTMKRKLG